MPGGDRARGAGAQLAQSLRFDEGEDLRPVDREERDHDARLAAEGRVRLQPGDAEVEVGGRHDVEDALVEPKPEPRPVLDPPLRDSLEAGFDGLHRVFRREQLVDVGFAQVEGHGAD
jgi:hypothetical protein